MYPMRSPFDPPPPEEGLMAQAGKPLEPGTPIADRESLIEALRGVHDPEIPVNIYDLGLIYDLHIADNGDVSVKMSLTAPACPVAGEMPGQVAEALAAVEGTGVIEVELIWDPPWTPDLMSEDARMALDFY